MGLPAFTVYIDQIFLNNLLINCITLWAAGKLSRVSFAKWRLFLAAGIGGAYSILIFFPVTASLLSLGGKFLFSVLIVLIAFAPQPSGRLFLCLVFFYLCSFALGGSVFGFIYLMGGDQKNLFLTPDVLDKYFWPAVLLSLLVYGVAVRGGAFLLHRRFSHYLFKVPVVIHFPGSSVAVKALVDTGNQLRDPITGYPVMIVEYRALRDLLPQELKNTCEAGKEGQDIYSSLHSLSGTAWASRCCLIPFHSLGRERGLLLGVRPDGVEIGVGKKAKCTREVVVGIYGRTLGDGDYNALLHPQLLDP